LGLIGPHQRIREELFDFIVAELRIREQQAPHRIGPIRRKLENQKSDLLRFASLVDQGLTAIAREYEINESHVRKVFLMEDPGLSSPQRQSLEEQARKILQHRFYWVQKAIEELLGEVIRASSVIENLNSRLRNYFFLRKQIGSSYLDLLRFFLNHRRFVRSKHSHRIGKTPRELMTGQSHPHWLDLLELPPCRLAA